MSYTLEEQKDSITICVDGGDEKEAFQDGGRALFEIMTKGSEKCGNSERVKVVIDAPSLAKLFEEWLTELAQKSKDGALVFSECSIATIQKVSSTQYLLTGAAYGVPFDETRHVKNHDVCGISKVSCQRDESAGMTVCRSAVAIS